MTLPSFLRKRHLIGLQAVVMVALVLYLTVFSVEGYLEPPPKDNDLLTKLRHPKTWYDSLMDPAAAKLKSEQQLRLDIMQRVKTYPPAIMDANSTSVKRLICKPFNHTRYEHLKAPPSDAQKKYYFALNLRDCHYILPRLMGSIVEVMRFLGPQNSVLSIVEGNSADGTAEVLIALREELQKIGVSYYYRHSDVNPSSGERILHLAELRNFALEPLVNSRKYANERARLAGQPPQDALPDGALIDIADDATVAFINDVSICPDDILELLHQRKIQKADMTCGMDWSWILKYRPFYDVWVARQLNGDSFFEISEETGAWIRPWVLFHNDNAARARYEARRPVQVFACWNGAAIFSAKPVMHGEVAFRDKREGECPMGEPAFFNKDLWFNGHGRFAIVPTVNLAYKDADGRGVKKKYGYVSDLVRDEQADDLPLQISWQDKPPEKVVCMKGWGDRIWVPWNETLV